MAHKRFTTEQMLHLAEVEIATRASWFLRRAGHRGDHRLGHAKHTFDRYSNSSLSA